MKHFLILKFSDITPAASTTENLEEKIILTTFVPLSEVKHSAPPGWVSKVHCTLPPTGKAETVKLRTLQNNFENRPRPRSTHLSPYRNQSNRGSNVSKTIKHSSRCGSLSPTSVSPTRQVIVYKL